MKAIEWLDDRLKILDQTMLPTDTAFLETSDYRAVVTAIKEMKVRGAPAIGVAAAYGIALGARNINSRNKKDFLDRLDEIMQRFATARPTAVNPFHAIEKMRIAAIKHDTVFQIKEALLDEAKRIHSEEEAATKRISQLGAELIKDGFTVMTP